MLIAAVGNALEGQRARREQRAVKAVQARMKNASSPRKKRPSPVEEELESSQNALPTNELNRTLRQK